MSDLFRRLNVIKQRCFYCAPFRGENHGLKPLKEKARRSARLALKRTDRRSDE